MCIDDEAFKLYRVKTDGSAQMTVNADITWFNQVAGDWVYYTNGDSNIYRISTDGSRKETFASSLE